jgi:hypothetical protein
MEVAGYSETFARAYETTRRHIRHFKKISKPREHLNYGSLKMHISSLTKCHFLHCHIYFRVGEGYYPLNPL